MNAPGETTAAKRPAAPTPMDRLAGLAGVSAVETNTLDAWLAGEGASVLLFSGVAKGRDEAQDVAVVLCEMVGLFAGRLRIGIVDPAAEDRLRGGFGVLVLPSLVFMNGPAPRRIITRIRDWAVYEQAFAEHLALATVPRPSPSSLE
jgi:hydrogenase-1 operon protein HyaE